MISEIILLWEEFELTERMRLSSVDLVLLILNFIPSSFSFSTWQTAAKEGRCPLRHPGHKLQMI